MTDTNGNSSRSARVLERTPMIHVSQAPSPPVERVPPSPRGPNVELTRQLGLITAIACGVGSVIASGVFKKPGLMATQLGSPVLLILVWIVAGFATLFGALSIAEISGMFRDPGGQYVYFNKGYNRFVGYLYGWATFIVIQTGSIASIAYVFADSLGYFVAFPRLARPGSSGPSPSLSSAR